MATCSVVKVSEFVDSECEVSDHSDAASEHSSYQSEEDNEDALEAEASNDESEGSEDENHGWADAMANILKSATNAKMLSKAKKDADITIKNIKEDEFDVEKTNKTDSNAENIDVSLKKKRKLDVPSNVKTSKSKLLKKQLWENMCKSKPDVAQKEAERTLTRIATRGVVQLFNAVKQQQKAVETVMKDAGHSEVKKDKVLKSCSKSAFLDLLKGSSTTKEESPRIKKGSDEGSSKWSVLRDDFMMGATMKDWDKEGSEDEKEERDVT